METITVPRTLRGFFFGVLAAFLACPELLLTALACLVYALGQCLPLDFTGGH